MKLSISYYDCRYLDVTRVEAKRQGYPGRVAPLPNLHLPFRRTPCAGKHWQEQERKLLPGCGLHRHRTDPFIIGNLNKNFSVSVQGLTVFLGLLPVAGITNLNGQALRLYLVMVPLTVNNLFLLRG